MEKIEQRRVRYIGAIKNLFGRTVFYVSILNFIMISSTTYVIVIKNVINISFILFIFIILGIIILAMIFEFKFVLPSETAFLNWQTYEHNNPLRTDLEEIKKDLDYLKKIK